MYLHTLYYLVLIDSRYPTDPSCVARIMWYSGLPHHKTSTDDARGSGTGVHHSQTRLKYGHGCPGILYRAGFKQDLSRGGVNCLGFPVRHDNDGWWRQCSVSYDSNRFVTAVLRSGAMMFRNGFR